MLTDSLKDRDLVCLRTHVSYSLKGEKKVRTYMNGTLKGSTRRKKTERMKNCYPSLGSSFLYNSVRIWRICSIFVLR
jgi:hypothetical protein